VGDVTGQAVRPAAESANTVPALPTRRHEASAYSRAVGSDEQCDPPVVSDLAASITDANERRQLRHAPGQAPPKLTRKDLAGAGYWFGPRSGRLGWGWTPVSWQGWLVTAGFVVAAVVAEVVGDTEAQDGVLAIPLALALLVICWVKGTAPGPSKRSRRQLEEIQTRVSAQRQ